MCILCDKLCTFIHTVQYIDVGSGFNKVICRASGRGKRGGRREILSLYPQEELTWLPAPGDLLKPPVLAALPIFYAPSPTQMLLPTPFPNFQMSGYITGQTIQGTVRLQWSQ